MRHNPKLLAWAVALALMFFFASAPPAHAQAQEGQCSAICNANVDCSTGCIDGLVVEGEVPNETTCGDGHFPCCTQTSNTSAYCTAEFLNENYTCVYVSRTITVTTCGTNTTTTINGQRFRTPNATCATCPTFSTPGCEDVGPSPICG